MQGADEAFGDRVRPQCPEWDADDPDVGAREDGVRHVDSVADLHPDTVAFAYGPLLSGDAIDDAFDRVRAMAAAPRVMPPGQSALHELIAATALGHAAA